jgi:hypothetical protein
VPQGRNDDKIITAQLAILLPANSVRHAKRQALQLALCAGHMRVVHYVAEARDAALGARLELAPRTAAHTARRHHVAPAGECLEPLRGGHMPEPSREVKHVYCAPGARQRSSRWHVTRKEVVRQLMDSSKVFLPAVPPSAASAYSRAASAGSLRGTPLPFSKQRPRLALATAQPPSTASRYCSTAALALCSVP